MSDDRGHRHELQVPASFGDSPRWWHDAERARAWLVVRTVHHWLWCKDNGLTEDPHRCPPRRRAARGTETG